MLEFRDLVTTIQTKLTQRVDNLATIVFEGDEDEEFTYGAFGVALANLNYKEWDWLLERQFGNVYSITFCAAWVDE
jgi:hypothetical protein